MALTRRKAPKSNSFPTVSCEPGVLKVKLDPVLIIQSMKKERNTRNATKGHKTRELEIKAMQYDAENNLLVVIKINFDKIIITLFFLQLQITFNVFPTF